MDAKKEEEQQAREYAKEWLAFYVKRGQSVASFIADQSYHIVHSCGMLYVVQHGGRVYYEGKVHRIAATQVVIKAMGEEKPFYHKTCLYIFEIAELFAELHAPLLQLSMSQPSLWES